MINLKTMWLGLTENLANGLVLFTKTKITYRYGKRLKG